MSVRVPPLWIWLRFPVVPFINAADGWLTENPDYLRLESWWRDVPTNASAGGDAWSQHLIGTALDVIYDDPAARDRALQSAGKYGLVALPSGRGRTVHVQLLPAFTLRDAALRAGFETFDSIVQTYA